MKSTLWADVNSFPSCCGMDIIHNMSVSDETRGYVNVSNYTTRNHIALVAVTAGYQRKEISKLKKLGFEKMFRFKNVNTGRMLTMWARGKIERYE